MSALDDAIQRSMAHPACPMDDPLTAAQAESMDEAALARYRAHEGDDESEAERIAAQRRAAWARDYDESIAIGWPALLVAAVVVVAVVSAFSLLWPMGWAP